MGESFGCVWDDIAESDDFVFDDSQHLGQGAIDDPLQEGAGLLERKAVNSRLVPLFRRDRIDRVIGRRRI